MTLNKDEQRELAQNNLDGAREHATKLQERLDRAVAHRQSMVPGSEAHMAQFSYCDALERELGEAREWLELLEKALA